MMFEKLFLDQPIVLFLLVFVAALSAMKGIIRPKPRRKWRNRSQYSKNYKGASNDHRLSLVPQRDQTPTDIAAEQLKAVMQANFQSRPLLNSKEMRVFAAIEKLLETETVDWRVMAQVSLGEIVGSPDNSAYMAINSKRVDLLLVDGAGMPLHAIEYQGAGHHQAHAAVRDAVKKEALRRAGIGYEEVNEGDKLEDLRALITKLVRKSKTQAHSALGKK
jgi:hypothetical protein